MPNLTEHKPTFIDGTEKDNFYSFRLVRTPNLGRQLARWCAGIFIGLLLLTFLPWTQNIRSTGNLTTLRPGDRPQTIHSTIAGRIERWHIMEGQRVNKGDTIISLSEIKDKYFDPELIERLGEQVEAKRGALQRNQEKAEAQERQIAALQQGLQVSMSKARNKLQQARLKVDSDSMDLVAAATNLEIARVQLNRQQKLLEQGLKSQTEVEQRRLKLQESQAKIVSAQNNLSASRQELANARLEFNSLTAEYNDKISKAQSELESTKSYVYQTEGEISKMRNEQASTIVRSSFYNITAPQNGYVVKALKSGLGETVKEGEPVASIMPANPQLAAQLYVKPMDIPLLKVGRKVRLQFDGWPTLVFSGWPGVSFGTFGGIVAVIDNIDSQGSYRILVTPDPDQEKWPDPLRVGSGVYGWVMLNDVPIWYEMWRQLNGFPPDYMQETALSPAGQSVKPKEKNNANTTAAEY